jgi:ATP phosphoribosyltransferase regulatory subunit HisZ
MIMRALLQLLQNPEQNSAILNKILQLIDSEESTKSINQNDTKQEKKLLLIVENLKKTAELNPHRKNNTNPQNKQKLFSENKKTLTEAWLESIHTSKL